MKNCDRTSNSINKQLAWFSLHINKYQTYRKISHCKPSWPSSMWLLVTRTDEIELDKERRSKKRREELHIYQLSENYSRTNGNSQRNLIFIKSECYFTKIALLHRHDTIGITCNWRITQKVTGNSLFYCAYELLGQRITNYNGIPQIDYHKGI